MKIAVARTASEEMWEVTCCHNIKMAPEQAADFAIRLQAEDEAKAAVEDWPRPMMAIDYLYLWDTLGYIRGLRTAIRLLYKTGKQGVNY